MNTRTTYEVPRELRLACGHDVPHEIGQPIYNYYDMEAGEITRLADRPEPDTSGLLPNNEAWWVDTTAGLLDGSRMICTDCAVRKGWLVKRCDAHNFPADEQYKSTKSTKPERR
jgi:hypothetical protein